MLVKIKKRKHEKSKKMENKRLNLCLIMQSAEDGGKVREFVHKM